MDRFCALCSRLFTYLTVTLMALGIVAVPSQFAFADSSTDCDAMCSTKYMPGTDLYNSCVSQCSACSRQCSSDYRFGTSGYQSRMDECVGFAVAATCPNPVDNSCPINNGNPAACPGLACATKGSICWCVNGPITTNCYCP